MTVTGASSQSANLLNVSNTTGSVLSITNNGATTITPTNSGSVPLTVTGASGQSVNIFDVKNNSGAVIVGVGSNGAVTFSNNTNSSTTNVYAAVMISAGGLYVHQDLRVAGQTNSSTFNATSDYRLKTNVQPLSELRTVDRLIPCEYDMSGGLYQMGFIAHEVQDVFPFLVSGEKDGEAMQTINYNGFIALLVKEIQELKRENRSLRSRVEKLESCMSPTE